MFRSSVICGLLVVLVALGGSCRRHGASGSDDSFKNHYNKVRIIEGLYYQSTYDKINKYLVINVQDVGAEKNLAAAKSWLAEEKGKIHSWLSHAIVEALEQFVSLEEIHEDNMCNRVSYGILYKNNKATEDHARKAPKDIGPLRRVDSIVYEYSKEHAQHCKGIYPQKFAEMKAELDEDSLRRVNFFIDTYLEKKASVKSWFKNSERHNYVQYTQDMKYMYGKNAAKAAFDALKQFTVEDPDKIYLAKVNNELKGKLEVNGDKVASLVDKYLVKPCLHYVTALGPDLFVPANYDWAFMEPEARVDTSSTDGHNFYLGWVRFRLCRRLVDKDRTALIKNVISLANTNSI